MQTGDYFNKLADLEAQLGESFPRQEFLVGPYIHSLRKRPDTAA